MFSYPLSPFQKFAIEGIVKGEHVLVTAHTGSGKSTPFEFAAEHFFSLGKKIIYCSPIKALSNQKFYDFTQRYPHISVGIVTGDIRVNQEASLLIVTTEILHNVLFLKKHKPNSNLESNIETNNKSLLSFDMDFDNELGCVVFDEFHYINDPDRGAVWENSILMLPLHIQILMLSATLDAPNKVAAWIESRDSANVYRKQVYISSTTHREVPLQHYSFITVNQGIFKAVKKDEVLCKEIKDSTNTLTLLQNEKGVFNEVNYDKVHKMLKLFENKQVWVKRQHVINNVCKYLVENGLLPAIFFVLSRKQLEQCAKEVTVSLLEFDSKVPYTARREAEAILRKLPNYKEYMELPEFNELVSLLEKGVAIHHAGMISVFREIVELFLCKGYVKVLFCTETFALGVNFPIKTVLFTSATKFDGNSQRVLYSHEYTQMAGRAGRRGHDTVGTVIHLNNLFRDCDLTSYRNMMRGIPQTLVSKFKISYNLILNLIDIGDKDYLKFCERSMIQDDILTKKGGLYRELAALEEDLQKFELSMNSFMRTPREKAERLLFLEDGLSLSSNKKRKEMLREIEELKDSYKFILNDKNTVIKHNYKLAEISRVKREYYDLECILNNNIHIILGWLLSGGFIRQLDDVKDYVLTPLGYIATHLKEVHCLVFSEMIHNGSLDKLSSRQLVALFSCFTNITVGDDFKAIVPKCSDQTIKLLAIKIHEQFEKNIKFESETQLATGVNYDHHYDLLDKMDGWCNAASVEECKWFLQELEKDKGIFLGEFVKAILKINSISNEMEKISESIGNMELLSKLREIPELTLKFVATTQSLYI
uniref:Helicase n=1 Tax=viral metagenome TaxID=1070528 RepID=A0A6C0KUH0_9ZZZZ